MSQKDVHPMNWLMAWYQSQCDGDWEHQHGIRIGTLDNPGWSLDVDLVATPVEDRVAPQQLLERSEKDWLFVEVKENTFRARGGPGNLGEMIDAFRKFVSGAES